MPVKVIGASSALSRVTSGETSIVTDGTFLVRAGGEVVEVWPDDAVWSSNVRTKAERKKVEPDGETTVTTHEELIPVGGRAVVAARMPRTETGGLRAVSTGSESLLIFATADAQDPVKELEAFVRSDRRGTIVQLVLLGLTASIAFALVLR